MRTQRNPYRPTLSLVMACGLAPSLAYAAALTYELTGSKLTSYALFGLAGLAIGFAFFRLGPLTRKREAGVVGDASGADGSRNTSPRRGQAVRDTGPEPAEDALAARPSLGSRELDEVLAACRQLESQVATCNEQLQLEVAARKRAEESLHRLADYDALTGLPNAVLFNDRLEQALARAARQGLKPSVMFLDLDRFKTINDTLGHAVGDRVLQGVGKRLTSCLRAEDTVGRMGGDEFQLLLPSHIDARDAVRVAEKLLQVLKPPFHVDGHELYVDASIGISMYPADGTTSGALVRNADAALHRAKEQGPGAYQLYAPEMNAIAIERLTLGNRLRRALQNEEFLLHYQPVVQPSNGEIFGLEALVRWQHPEEGLLAPGRFIRIAEETGLIVPLGEWVLRTACHECKSWQRSSATPVHVAVNVSARQFRQSGFVELVSSACDEALLDPRLLTLEVTESLIMDRTERTVGMLRDLKRLGVGLSIDDFGTGYSSLSYLKSLPIDTLKIDQSFVRDVSSNSDDATIAKLIISMAHGLKLKVVAEGVETEAQLAFLLPQNCDAMQGYLFSRPVSAEVVRGLLDGVRSWSSRLPGVPIHQRLAVST